MFLPLFSNATEDTPLSNISQLSGASRCVKRINIETKQAKHVTHSCLLQSLNSGNSLTLRIQHFLYSQALSDGRGGGDLLTVLRPGHGAKYIHIRSLCHL